MAMAMPGAGGTPIQIIERAQSSDNTLVSQARLENQASLRILLSDSPNDLPSPTSAISLNTAFPSTWYTVDSCHAPLATSPGPVPLTSGTYKRSYAEQDNDFLAPAGTSLIGGYIEIDIQTASGTWQNVTADILQQGITSNANLPGTFQNHPIIHFEKPNYKYACNPNPGTPTPGGTAGPCVNNAVGSTNPYDFLPINMYDTREGNARDVSDGTIHVGGVMNIVELDVGNLQKWFANDSYGQQALFNGGYIVYFSDRRGNYCNANCSANGGYNALGETGNTAMKISSTPHLLLELLTA